MDSSKEATLDTGTLCLYAEELGHLEGGMEGRVLCKGHIIDFT